MKIKIELNLLQIFTIISLIAISSLVLAEPQSTSYKIPKITTSSGENMSSSSYMLETSVESIIANVSSTTYQLCMGYQCCNSDLLSKLNYINVNNDTGIATIQPSVARTDICSGAIDIQTECAVDCNPCLQSCTNSSSIIEAVSTEPKSGTVSLSVVEPVAAHSFYCKSYDTLTSAIYSCFNISSLTVTCEAGGPYSSSSTILVFGNSTYLNNIPIQTNITVNFWKSGASVASKSTTSGSQGRYSTEFTGLEAGSYIANVTAVYSGIHAYCTDPFIVQSPVACTQTKTITLGGYAVDYDTGLLIPSGTVNLAIVETGDIKSTTVTNGYWSTNITSCLISGSRYTLGMKITDNLGKISYSQLEFIAP